MDTGGGGTAETELPSSWARRRALLKESWMSIEGKAISSVLLDCVWERTSTCASLRCENDHSDIKMDTSGVLASFEVYR
jgi:hypothetical protein